APRRGGAGLGGGGAGPVRRGERLPRQLRLELDGELGRLPGPQVARLERGEGAGQLGGVQGYFPFFDGDGTHASTDSTRTCSRWRCRSGGGSAMTAKNGRLLPGSTLRSVWVISSARLSLSTSAAERSDQTSSAVGAAPATASARASAEPSEISSAVTRIGPRVFSLRFSTRPRM